MKRLGISFDNFVVVLIAAASLIICTKPLSDPDLGWHLVAGFSILENLSWPQADFISPGGKFWLCYSWLPEVLLALIYQIGSISALHFTQYLFMVLSIVSVVYCVRAVSRDDGEEQTGARYLSEWITIIVVILLLSRVWHLRPQVLSFVFFAILLVLAQRKLLQVKYLFVLTVVWVNTHLYWLLVPAIVFLERVLFPENRLIKERQRGFVLTVFCLLLGLLNPYGIKLFQGMREYMMDHDAFYGIISELLPLRPEGGLSYWFFIAVIIATAVLTQQVVKKQRASVILLFMVFAFAAVTRRKYLPLFAVASIPLLVQVVVPSIVALIALNLKRIPLLHSVFAVRMNNGSNTRGLLAIVLVGCLISGILVWRGPSVEKWRSALFPVVEQLAASNVLPDQQEVIVLSDFDVGGWLALGFWFYRPTDVKVSRFKVAVVGRNLMLGEKRIKEYMKLLKLEQNWQQILREWDVDVVILPRVPTRTKIVEFLLEEKIDTAQDSGKWRVFSERGLWEVIVRE